MRILHVMASGEPGGGSNALAELLPALRERGIESRVVTSPAGTLADRLEADGFDVRRFETMGQRGDPRLTVRLARIEADERADLVHVHGTRAGFVHFSWPFARRAVYTAHGLAYRQVGSARHRGVRLATELLICRRAATVVTVSAADLADLRRRGFVSERRSLHIPNAVDTGRFRPRDRTVARARLGLGEELVVGTVARLVPGKAVEDLVDAVAGLPGTTLVVVGDGPERAALEERARGAGVDARFTGTRADVEELIPAFDVFVLPSLWEGEPITLLEAMAAGVPAVSTATDGGREALGADRGLIVPLRDPGAIRDAVLRLRADPALARSCVAAGLDHIRGRSWATAAGAYERVYAAAIGGQR